MPGKAPGEVHWVEGGLVEAGRADGLEMWCSRANI